MNFYIFYTKGGRRGTDPLLENFQPSGEGCKSSNPIVGNYLRIWFKTKLSSVRGLLPPEPAIRRASRMGSVNFAKHIIRENDFIY